MVWENHMHDALGQLLDRLATMGSCWLTKWLMIGEFVSQKVGRGNSRCPHAKI